MQFLIDKGFRLDKVNSFENSNSIKEMWYKRLSTDLYCKCNEKPPNLIVERYKFSFPSFMYEVRVCGEKEELGWVDYKIYSISEEDFLNKLEIYEGNLIRLWELESNFI